MNTDLLNQIKQQFILLSFVEKQDLVKFLSQQLEQQKNSVRSETNLGSNRQMNKLRECERRWIEKHCADYAGQWVALDGDKLLSHGNDGRKVYAEAKSKNVEVPFVVHLESVGELPFGGW